MSEQAVRKQAIKFAWVDADDSDVEPILRAAQKDIRFLWDALDQECALRAQAEQDVSLLRRERDEARAEAELANAACSGENGRFYRKWARTQERLRVTDVLKREYEEALTKIAAMPYSKLSSSAAQQPPLIARAALAVSGGREAWSASDVPRRTPDTKEPK